MSRNVNARYNIRSSGNTQMASSNDSIEAGRNYNESNHNEFTHSEFRGTVNFGAQIYAVFVLFILCSL